VLLAVVSASGCGLIVSSTVPAFQCVPGRNSCPGGQYCNPATAQCTPLGDGGPPDAALGDALLGCRDTTCHCSGDTDCNSGLCAGELSVTSDVYAQAGHANFCTTPCCTSLDCDAKTVCFATGAGGNYCVPPAWLGRPPSPGNKPVGASCVADGDCRSALCAMGTCADTCCSVALSSAECGSGTTCRYGTFPGYTFDTHTAAFCVPATGNVAAGAACGSSTACADGFCDSLSKVCRDACRAESDCNGGICTYALYAATGGVQVLAACIPMRAGATQGAMCNAGSDCNSGLCSPTTHECTNPCFADSDCVPAGRHCLPETVQLGGSYSVLFCGP
jgi:hypothetical protein